MHPPHPQILHETSKNVRSYIDDIRISRLELDVVEYICDIGVL